MTGDGKPAGPAGPHGVIRFQCACGKALTARRTDAGRKVPCPQCKKPLVIPTPGREAGPTCKNHPTARRVADCMACKAPLCRPCKDARGYFCSDACREKVEAQHPRSEVSPEEREADRKAIDRSGRLWKWTKIGVAATAAGIVLWIAYAYFFSTRGEIAWELPLAITDHVRGLLEHGGQLFVLKGDGKMIRVDAKSGQASGELSLEGEPSWMFDEPVRLPPDRVLVSQQDSLVCVALSDFRIAWRHEGPATSLAASGSVVYLVEGFRWKRAVETAPPVETRTPIGTDEYGYPVYAPEPPPTDESKPKPPEILALDAGSGVVRWRAPVPTQGSSPRLAATAGVLFVCEERYGFGDEAAPTGDSIVALSEADGKRLWKAGGSFSIAGRLIPCAEAVIVPTRSGVTCLGARDGAQKWQYALPAGASARGDVRMWLFGDRLYVAVGYSLSCVEASSGRPLWSIATGGWIQNVREDGGRLLVSGEVFGKIADVLKEGPLLTPGADLMRDIMTKEMGDMAKATPFTAVIDPSGPTIVCAVDNAGGVPAIVDGDLIVADSVTAPNLLDTVSGGVEMQAKVTGYKLKGGKLRWQKSMKGTMTGVTIKDGMLYGVMATPAKGDKQAGQNLVAIHVE